MHPQLFSPGASLLPRSRRQRVSVYLLEMMTFVVNLNRAEKLDNLVRARTSVLDKIHKNREQLYRHGKNVRQQD